MARQLRFRIPGYPQHIIQRGNDRQACFFEDRDYLYYLRCLSEASLDHECDIHAYVLMTNHVHLLATPRKPDGISRLMQSVGRKFVRMINARHHRTGTLWEGRYKATLVDSNEYLLACYRYIELNPVRAGLVVDPGDYVWSSYRVHVGTQESPLIRDHGVFLGLGENDSSRQRSYKRLFETELSAGKLFRIRESTNKSRPLGDERFEATINRINGSSKYSRPWGGKRIGAGGPRRVK